MNEKPSLLIIDDNASDIKILATLFQNDYIVKVSLTPKRGIELAISEPIPDLILLDVMMPNMSGFEVIEKLQSHTISSLIPVIFITSNNSSSDETKGLESGAVDYITKPIHPAITRARVSNHIKLKKQRDRLLYSSFHDQLTGLYNRHHLQEVGVKMFANSKRHDIMLTAIMIDIDYFKLVNDKYGHSAGDSVLVEIATLLSKNMRTEDFSFRFGGEEFLMILENCSVEFATLKAETIRVNIENSYPCDIAISASFGVAQLQESHLTMEGLIKDADKALYMAKEKGRNRVISCNNECYEKESVNN